MKSTIKKVLSRMLAGAAMNTAKVSRDSCILLLFFEPEFPAELEK